MNITVNVQSAIGLYASGFMRNVYETECIFVSLQLEALHSYFILLLWYLFRLQFLSLTFEVYFHW